MNLLIYYEYVINVEVLGGTRMKEAEEEEEVGNNVGEWNY